MSTITSTCKISWQFVPKIPPFLPCTSRERHLFYMSRLSLQPVSPPTKKWGSALTAVQPPLRICHDVMTWKCSSLPNRNYWTKLLKMNNNIRVTPFWAWGIFWPRVKEPLTQIYFVFSSLVSRVIIIVCVPGRQWAAPNYKGRQFSGAVVNC